MADFVEVSDFTGVYLLAKDTYSIDVIQSYIDTYEKQALVNLLGATLAQEVIDADEPLDPEIAAIVDPFDIDESCTVLHSNGLKFYLKGMIYFQRVIGGRLSPSPNGGAVELEVEAGSVHTNRAEIYQRYNDAIDTGKAIQARILHNSQDYPNFNGQPLRYIY